MMSALIAPQEKCTRCGSSWVKLDWEERVNPREIQCLWKCLQCKNEFVTLVASDEEPVADEEIVKPFFTNLLVA